ncbi:MAG: hypothetical protein E7213_01850, partial [Clostridium sp.]|nr:hypothetical protein [Clostridium sp.]
MKGDIKVNYGTLDEIVKKLRKYKNALNSMERSIENMNSKIENENKGESVSALIYKYQEIKRQIKSCEREIDDLYNIFRSYISDMTSIIRPISYHQMMRVSRNDIYWNMKEIFGSVDKIKRLKNKSLFGNVTNPFNDDEQKKNEEENAQKLKQAVKDIEKYYNRLET